MKDLKPAKAAATKTTGKVEPKAASIDDVIEKALSNGDITEYETLVGFLSMLNEDSSIVDCVFFQSLYSAQHKQRAIRKEGDANGFI